MQRSAFRAVAALILIVVVGLVVFGAYQAGVAVGAGGPGTAGTVAPYAMRYWGFGWGFPFFFHPLGLLFGLFFLFLFFWVLRALFWGGRGHRGDWYGSWEDRRRDAFEAWHREAHAHGEPHGHDAPPTSGSSGDRPTSGPIS